MSTPNHSQRHTAADSPNVIRSQPRPEVVRTEVVRNREGIEVEVEVDLDATPAVGIVRTPAVDVLDLLLDVDVSEEEEVDGRLLARIVRDVSPLERSTIVDAVLASDLDPRLIVEASRIIRGAPTEATPADRLVELAAGQLDAAATLLRSSAAVDGVDLDLDECVETFAASLARAVPMPVDQAVDLARVSTSTSRSRSTSTSTARESGDYVWLPSRVAVEEVGPWSTPGRSTHGIAPGLVEITVDQEGTPTFLAIPDATAGRGSESFRTATRALRWCDGFPAGPGGSGHRSPFSPTGMRRVDESGARIMLRDAATRQAVTS